MKEKNNYLLYGCDLVPNSGSWSKGERPLLVMSFTEKKNVTIQNESLNYVLNIYMIFEASLETK
jgi:hypothetical protein